MPSVHRCFAFASCVLRHSYQSVPGRRVYVGSLDYTVNETIIRQLFSPFGTILSVDMPIDPAYVPRLCSAAGVPPERG